MYINNIDWYEVNLESVSKDFTKDKQTEISLNGAVYDFSVNHSLIEKEDILNIHEDVMAEPLNIIKYYKII